MSKNVYEMTTKELIAEKQRILNEYSMSFCNKDKWSPRDMADYCTEIADILDSINERLIELEESEENEGTD